MRVAKISTGLACGLAVILLLGVGGAAAVGILLGQEGGRSTDPSPGAGLTVPSTTAQHHIRRAIATDFQVMAPAGGTEWAEQAYPASVGDDGPSEVLLSRK
jgi:hypothetical protein